MDLLQSSYMDPDPDHTGSPPLPNPPLSNADVGEANPSPDSSPVRISLPAKSSAPTVDDTMLALTVTGSKGQSKPLDPTQHMVSFNPTYDQLWAPIYGPAHPYAKDGIAQGLRNHKLGFVEDAAIESFVFDEQYNTFYKYGYAADPSANNFVGDLDAMQESGGVSVYNIRQNEQKRRKIEKMKEKLEKLREIDGEGEGNAVDSSEVDNPASEVWVRKNRKSPWAGKKEGVGGELTEEQKKYAEEYAKKKGGEGENEGSSNAGMVDKSTFHGKEATNFATI